VQTPARPSRSPRGAGPACLGTGLIPDGVRAAAS
jgi:hypothetical protein